jgi:hypothetical protein
MKRNWTIWKTKNHLILINLHKISVLLHNHSNSNNNNHTKTTAKCNKQHFCFSQHYVLFIPTNFPTARPQAHVSRISDNTFQSLTCSLARPLSIFQPRETKSSHSLPVEMKKKKTIWNQSKTETTIDRDPAAFVDDALMRPVVNLQFSPEWLSVGIGQHLCWLLV